MRASKIMTEDVVTVRAETPVREIAALMVDKRISGVPVVDESGQLIGIVSQGDLLHRTEVGTERKRKWWLQVFSDPNELAREYAKAHGLKARDVMSRSVVTIGDDAELADVADLMDRRRIKRLPVVRGGRLAGIITRGDLVRALTQAGGPGPAGTLSDGALYKAVTERMRAQSWLNSSLINVSVKDGVVQLAGFIESQDQRHALRVLAEETEGVARVEDTLKVGPRSLGNL